MKCNVGQRYNKFPSDNEICNRIRNIAHENGLSKDAADVICKVYRYKLKSFFDKFFGIGGSSMAEDDSK